MKVHAARIRLRVCSFVYRYDIEFPHRAAVELGEDIRIDRDAVPFLPAESFGDRLTGDQALLVGEPRVAIGVGDHYLVIDDNEVFRVYGEHAKLVPWILVITAEPVEMDYREHVLDRTYAVHVSNREDLSEVDLVQYDEAVVGSQVDACIEGFLERGQCAEDHEGDEGREHGQE